MKYILIVAAVLSLSLLTSDSFSNISSQNEMSSQLRQDLYYRVVNVNGILWMYVYSDPGGTVLIDRYKIEE